jgi:hypothetical protein
VIIASKREITSLLRGWYNRQNKMRLLKRVLIVMVTLLALAFLLLHVGPDIDTDADTDAQVY